MGARFAPFSFGGLLLQSYRPHLTQASCTHLTGIPLTSNLVGCLNVHSVNTKKMKLCCVQMIVRIFIENYLGRKSEKEGEESQSVHLTQKESPRKLSVFKGLSGRNRTRTCDPIDVNDVLYQLSHATFSRTYLALLG